MFKKAATKGETTRQQILDTALRLFRERGFDEATMRDIASEAGVSLGNAYYYFPSKEAIVLAYYDLVQTEHARRVLAEVALDHRKLILTRVHVYGVDIEVNDLGVSGIRQVVRDALEELGVDEISIEGAVRTTGAGPGRAPRRLRFARPVPPDEQADGS